MKEKKNKGVRKALLVAISAALVVAISVGSTLAYLTAKTDPKDNTFTASGDITGRVNEFNWNSSSALNISPGHEVSKDPTVDNETSDAAVWVGAKVTFFIDIGDTTTGTGGPIQVDEATFTHFVTLTGWKGTGWTEATATEKTTAAVPATDKATYLSYGTVLSKDAATGAETSYAAGSTDHSNALFTAVTLSENVDIVDDTNLTNKVTYATNANLTSSADLSALHFKKFDFKIKINAHGVKAYTVNASGNPVGEQVTLATAKPDIFEELAKVTVTY